MSERSVSTVTRTVTISDLTPEEMASIFAQWDERPQAAFFHALAIEARSWPSFGGWEGQAWYIRKAATPEALEVLRALGDEA